MAHLLYSAGITDEAEQQRHFLRLWTLKEAYIKAHGRGVHSHPGLQVLSCLTRNVFMLMQPPCSAIALLPFQSNCAFGLVLRICRVCRQSYTPFIVYSASYSLKWGHLFCLLS